MAENKEEKIESDYVNRVDAILDFFKETSEELEEEHESTEEETPAVSHFEETEDDYEDDESQEPVPFVSLHNHSDHSLLDGFGKTIDYVKKAKELGYPGIGLTDHGSLAGIAKMFQECKQEGITFVPGCEFYVAPENPEGARVKEAVYYGTLEDRENRRDVSGRGSYLHISVWAINNQGLNNLFLLSSLSNLDENFYQKPRIDTEMLLRYSEGLVISTGCPSSEISTRFRLKQDDKAYAYARRLKETFGDRLFVEIMNHNMEQNLERELLEKQVELAKELDIPLLATNDCHYTHKEDAGVHEEFLAIQTKALMKTKKEDRFSFDGEGYYFKSGREMLRLFPEEKYPGAISNTAKIAEWAKGIEMEYNPDLRPKPVIPEGFKDEGAYLKHIVSENFNLPHKYGNADEETREKARKKIAEEYEVLAGSDFLGYMLIVSEYMNWIREKRSLRDDNGKILALPVGVGRGCFMPGSLVREGKRGSLKPIETFKIGDLVRTHDATHKTVTNVWEYDVENEDMLKISLSNGREILCTSDHKIFKKDEGFTEASRLSVGDVLLGPKGRKEEFYFPCGSCGKTIHNHKQGWESIVDKGIYKKPGEVWCYECVKNNIYNLLQVKEGALKGSERNKDEDVKARNSESLKKHWEENYEDRIVKYHEYMKTDTYKRANEKNRDAQLRRYSDPEELSKLINQGKGKYKKGSFYSDRQGIEIRYDSSYELKALNILETDSEVKSFTRSKERVPYIKPSTGKEHSYLPDFEVIYRNGKKSIIEIKSAWQLKEEDTSAKLEQAKSYFSKKEMDFEVWAEKELEERNDYWHNEITIDSIEPFKHTGKVYDLEVEDVHNYTVSDVTVHNSGGGSIIAFLLNITELDPLRHELLFERFVSPGRANAYTYKTASGTEEELESSTRLTVLKGGKHLKVIYAHELRPGDVIIEKEEREEENN